MVHHLFPSRAARLRASGFLLAAALALTACGGGGGAGAGSTAAAPPPPTAAVQPVVIATQPASQSVTAGQSVTFTVAATGDGLSYQWQRDGKDIPGLTTASYTIASAGVGDDGASFTVVVKNGSGSVTSAAATLKVTTAFGPGLLGLLAGPLGGNGNMDGPVGRFSAPEFIAASPSGTLYLNEPVPQTSMYAVRAITQAPGQDAVVSTLSRQESATIGAVDAAGNLYENDPNRIYKRTPAGVRTLVAGTDNVEDPGYFLIGSLVVDPSGTLYVADAGRDTVRKVTPQGIVTILAGSPGQAGAQDGRGDAARFTRPGQLAIDKAGNLYLGDDTVVRKITPDGSVTTLAGVRRDSPAAVDTNPAWFPSIDGVAVDPNGNVYVLSGNLRRIAPDGAVSHFIAPDQLHEVPFSVGHPMTQDEAGNMYLTSYDATWYDPASDHPSVVWRVTPAGGMSVIAGKARQSASVDGNGTAARFTDEATARPASSLATDAQGNVFITEGNRMRKVTRGGDVSTLALPATGTGGAPVAYYPTGATGGGDLLAFDNGVLNRIDASGNSHFLAGQAPQALETLTDGVGATASFVHPRGFVLDSQGNVYCLDQTPWRGPTDMFSSRVIRKIGADGTVTTLPVTNLPEITSWFVDRDGKLVMSTSSGEVLRLEADNSLSTLRPAPAHARSTVVAGDRSGNLYVADLLWNPAGNQQGSVLHKITPAGVDTVIAGKPDTVGVRLGSANSLNEVTSLAVGADGTVYIMTENSVLELGQ